jgi:large subunit ribosomal protein L4
MANVINASGKVVGDVKTPAIFENGHAANLHTVYRAVHRELANSRAGTASTKKRDEVAGGGRKPWRQKGTGRARQGSVRSPQWRHGGVVFGPQPRSFVEGLNKKERRAALIAALADRFKSDAIVVLDASDFKPTKTSELVELLFGTAKDAKQAPKTLVISGTGEAAGRAIARTGRNLRRVGVTTIGALDVKDVLRFHRLVFTSAAFDALSKSFGSNEGAK